jgi:hypothetical protein
MIWNQSDAAKLREYIQKNGNKFRLYLKTRIPTCDGITLEEVALKARFKEGFEKAIKEIDDMVASEEESSDPSAGSFTSM